MKVLLCALFFSQSVLAALPETQEKADNNASAEQSDRKADAADSKTNDAINRGDGYTARKSAQEATNHRAAAEKARDEKL